LITGQLKNVGQSKLAQKLGGFWLLRSKSEQRTLSIGALLLITLAVFFGIYEPLRKAHSRMGLQVQSQSVALKEISALMAARAAQQGLTATGAMTANLDAANQSASSLTAIVDQSIRSKNLQSGLKNITTVPPNKVRLELGGINFDVLMTTLEQLERESQVQVLELSIDTLGTSTVNAKVTLSR
jgi:type II secretory pathway component PulM